MPRTIPVWFMGSPLPQIGPIASRRSLMREWPRFDRSLIHLCCTLALLAAALTAPGSRAHAAAPVQMQPDGTLQIAGRAVQCGRARNVLDPHMPNLGMASRRRNEVILNPARLGRYPSTVGLFVFHHECGHHHVGGDELEADCWAVDRGVRDGWLDRRHLGSICSSFGNRRETATHPAAGDRCARLHQCFTAASATSAREARLSPPRDASARARRQPLYTAPAPERIEAPPPLPVGTLLLMFVALVLAARPRRRAEGTQTKRAEGAQGSRAEGTQASRQPDLAPTR